MEVHRTKSAIKHEDAVWTVIGRIESSSVQECECMTACDTVGSEAVALIDQIPRSLAGETVERVALSFGTLATVSEVLRPQGFPGFSTAPSNAYTY